MAAGNLDVFSGTQIKGIDNFHMGIMLCDDGYNLDKEFSYNGELFEKFRPSINKNSPFESGLQVKFLERKSTMTRYIVIAGTNDLSSEIYSDRRKNWISRGYTQYMDLAPILSEILFDARKEGYNVVVLGDSGAGLAAQWAQKRQGTDIFVTNTGSIYRNTDSSPPQGKSYTINAEGEVVSWFLGNPIYGEVYIIPNEKGRSANNLSKYDLSEARGILNLRVLIHKDRSYMINYTGQLFKQNELNQYRYDDINLKTAMNAEKQNLSFSYNPVSSLSNYFENNAVMDMSFLDELPFVQVAQDEIRLVIGKEEYKIG